MTVMLGVSDSVEDFCRRGTVSDLACRSCYASLESCSASREGGLEVRPEFVVYSFASFNEEAVMSCVLCTSYRPVHWSTVRVYFSANILCTTGRVLCCIVLRPGIIRRLLGRFACGTADYPKALFFEFVIACLS